MISNSFLGCECSFRFPLSNISEILDAFITAVEEKEGMKSESTVGRFLIVSLDEETLQVLQSSM